MTVTLDFPKIWELLKSFKDQCRSRGWKTSGFEDWVKTGDGYHNFLWIRTIHPSTFEKVAAKHKCVIRKNISYDIVDVSYTAWLFPQTPSKKLVETVANNSELSRRTAIYDLSWAYAGRPVCLRLNETDSTVFQEFEQFLTEKCGVEVKPVHTSMSVEDSEALA